MMTKRTLVDGPQGRAPKPRSGFRSMSLALIALALCGLSQAGCRSDGCSTCGLGNKINNGLQAVGDSVRSVGAGVGSLFHHKKFCGGGADCGCGGEVIEGGVVVDQGFPIAPGGMTVPAPGTIIPAPAIESEPTQLQAIPGSQQANPTSGSVSPTTKPSASRPVMSGAARSGLSPSFARSGTPARKGSDAEPAAYSASKPVKPSKEDSGVAELLENIAPVDLPSEFTRKAVATPNPAPNSLGTPSTSPTMPAAAEKISAVDGSSIVLPPISSFQAPGMARYASIAPSIAGGSAPSIEGLEWLKEKGCRTLIDLRRGTEVDPNFVDAVYDRGMVYISLPIMAKRLDSSRLARFDELVSRSENRPLYFCDTDGSRSALIWYIHQRVVGQEDPQAALGKAEELGLGAAEIKLAEDYLATQKPRAKAASSRVAMATPPTVDSPPALPTAQPLAPSTPADPAPLALPDAPSPPIAPVAAPAPHTEPTPGMLPGEHKPQASTEPKPDYRDPAAWKPVAALVLTGIGVPLAFWSRTMLSEFRHDRKRASLPGRVPRSLGAPGESDA